MARVPEVKLLAITPNPEELVCRAARNDYYTGDVHDDPFEDVMARVQGDTMEDKTRTLLERLILRGHWGVYEHPQLSLWFRVSRACLAQITRHRHASFDVQSMRYVNFGAVDPEDPADLAWPDSFTEEAVKSRETGFTEITMSPEKRRELVLDVYRRSLDAYNVLVEAGVPKEDARMLLPIGTHVNVTCSLNVRAALHVLNIRGAGDAQSEIRALSQGIEDLLAEHLPITMDIWRSKRVAIQKQRLAP